MHDLFSTQQLETLRALVDRIIPPDEFPGGWAAGVGDYLLRQLAQGDLRRLAATYRAGLDALDEEARITLQCRFYEADAADQDALLMRVEAGTVTATWPVNPSGFFALVIEHAMEGFYGAAGVSWRMIGFEVRG